MNRIPGVNGNVGRGEGVVSQQLNRNRFLCSDRRETNHASSHCHNSES
jgi:hypothetical protein